MRYSRFEWLTLTVGAVAIIGTVVVSLLGPAPIVEEIVAQLLLLGVLFGAVHWGRNGGFAAAVAAILLYIALRSPLILSEGMTSSVIQLIAIRTVTYGFIGIVGGEVCGRMKYTLARFEDALNIDGATHVYNGRFLSRLLANNLGMHGRYRVPFSVILIQLAPALTSELRPSRRRSLLRAVANHLRNDVRLVDEVGRLEDNTFVVILPQTPRDGAEVAAGRVRAGLCELLGARDESVIATVFGAPEDSSAIEALRDRVDADADAQSA